MIAAAMMLSMTACANNEVPNNGGKPSSESVAASSNGNLPNKPIGIEEDISVPPKEVSIWDVMPEIPVTDASAFTYEYNSRLGGMVVTDYLRESPKVRIPTSFEGEPVVKVSFGSCKKELTQLVMPDSVKEFKLSSEIKRALQYVNIPNSVTKIEKEAFNGCKGLTSVTIPDNVTEIGENAFLGCESLTSVTISDSVTTIGRAAFYECKALASVTIPDSVTEIGEVAFWCCENIKITYKDKTYDYEHIDDYLYDAINLGENGMQIEDGVLMDVSRELTEVVIPDSVTEIGVGAFRGCTELTSITIPDSVTKINRYPFSDCTNIQATYKGKTYDYEHIEDLYTAINGN